MKKGIKVLVSSFLAILGLSGCASKIMNPYSEEFTCPQTETGKCVPIQQAYLESLQEKRQDLLYMPTPSVEDKQKENATSFSMQNNFPQDSFIEAYSKYNEALLRKLQQMLENPKTPVLIPPQVVRVLILPYAGDQNTFYAERYAYIIVENPQWVFYNILNVQEENR
jgi:conjugal transfer pilus assembly protein TraV